MLQGKLYRDPLLLLKDLWCNEAVVQVGLPEHLLELKNESGFEESVQRSNKETSAEPGSAHTSVWENSRGLSCLQL